SMIRTPTPWRASSPAAKSPEGPAPIIKTSCSVLSPAICLRLNFVYLPYSLHVGYPDSCPARMLRSTRSAPNSRGSLSLARSEQLGLRQRSLLRGDWTQAGSMYKRCCNSVLDVPMGILLCGLP